jgi:uncharacterized integral membrane protein
MGEKQTFQPLTREDKITVVLYRCGIVLSTIIVSVLPHVVASESPNLDSSGISPSTEILAYGLYASIGMSVFFIHLYVGKLKTYLKNLYLISLACLVALLYIGKGSLSSALAQDPYCALLLLPLSGCLGFVTAKEAFCFKLIEGYVLSMVMPVYLVLISVNLLSGRGAYNGVVLIAVMLVIFTLRKVFMPIAYDIGDKSAYQ